MGLYDGNHLYAWQWYIAHLGKPLYRYGRKIGLPKAGALAMANIPGSLAHVGCILMVGDLEIALAGFAVSEIGFTGLFYAIHKSYQSMAKENARFAQLNNKTEKNLEILIEKQG